LNVGVALNMEARGTSGRSLMFETSDDNAWLVDVYARSVRSPLTGSIFYEIYKLLPNDTDFSIFKEAGMAGMNFAFIENAVYYHSPGDNLQNLDPGSLQHQGENVLAIARTLAGMDLSEHPAGNAAYVDFLGMGVIRWPAAWNVPLAGLAFLGLVLLTVVQVRRGFLSTGALLLGVLAAVLVLIASILLGLGVILLIGALHPYGIPWHAYPLPARIAVWSAALLSGSLVALWFSKRAGFWGLGSGAWIFWGLVSFLLAVFLPGAAIVFLVPVLTAVFLLGVGTIFRGPIVLNAVFYHGCTRGGWLRISYGSLNGAWHRFWP
jgi:hypothetical protein